MKKTTTSKLVKPNEERNDGLVNLGGMLVDPTKTTLEELEKISNRMISIEHRALLNILLRRGLVTKEEIDTEIKRVLSEATKLSDSYEKIAKRSQDIPIPKPAKPDYIG
jgi:hypothetical protein